MKSIFALLLTFLLVFEIFNIASVIASPSEIVVPEDYLTIKDAVGAANLGDTVVVLPGLYAEGQIIVNKPITLVAKGEVIIDGLQDEWGIYMNSSGATVRGFLVTNASGVGIYLASPACIVEGNIITENYVGVQASSGYNVIKQNEIIDNFGDGIFLAGWGFNTIEQNLIANNSCSGINLWLSNSNSIRENEVKKNGAHSIYLDMSPLNEIIENVIEGNWAGIASAWSYRNTITENTIRNNDMFGIGLFAAQHNIVEENEIAGSKYGIRIIGSVESHVEENRICSNSLSGINLTTLSSLNTVKENVILRNGEFDLYWDGGGQGNEWIENKYSTKNW